MLTLGIETSCDETAAAVLRETTVLANVVSSQVALHEKYGGVVPELASREHLRNLMPVVREALDRAGVTIKDINLVAVTSAPGLIGALLVGVSAAKAMAYSLGIPFIGVHHGEAHILAAHLEYPGLGYPYIALLASGGHTPLYHVREFGSYRLLGQTRDDAAGEAFEKVAKLLDRPYPGGPVNDRLAQEGDRQAVHFPRGQREGYDFSFSGHQLFRECSHFCEIVTSAEQMPRLLEIAIQTAVSRRGVSVIVLPGDVALQPVEISPVRRSFTVPRPTVRPSDDEIDRLAGVLNGGGKITILGGAGCADAHDQLMAVAARLHAPIVHALRGKEFIQYDNPFNVGMTGLLGLASGYYAMMRCETLLMLGTDFPYQQFYPEHATVVQSDLRGEQIGRRTRVDMGLVGDVAATLTAVLPKLTQRSDDRHLKESVQHYQKALRELDELAVGETGHGEEGQARLVGLIRTRR